MLGRMGCAIGETTLDFGAAIDGAICSYQAGDLTGAEAACRAVLGHVPLEGDALHLLAVIGCDRGDPAAALAILARAIAGQPWSAVFHNTRARALSALGRLEDAEIAYRNAWSLNPGLAAVANNLACLLRERGRVAEAVAWFRKAAALLPGSADVARNLGDALAVRREYGAALHAFERAIALDPAAADSYAKCGAMLLAWGRPAEAEAMLRVALDRRPEDAASLNNLGLALRGRGRNEEAMACFGRVLRQDPTLADAHYNLGCLLLLANRAAAARASHDRALAAAPLNGMAMWGRCMAELPVLYETEEQVAECRLRYDEQLAVLERRAADPETARALAAAAGASQPFFLPYQGQCDRALQQRYGQLMAQLLRRPTTALTTAPGPGERIRLGIVSGFFCEHTLWRLMLKGWLSELDRSRFEVTAYHTGAVEDGQTEVARALCRVVTGSAEAVRAAIVADRPHALLYPEIGMDRVAARLGAERLAPLQCVSWGQPQTTGLPTMDLFFSSALMEPVGAAARYTEHLAALPGIGVTYAADERVADVVTRAELGVRDDAVVFWCGQALYKYLPQHDAVFARIATAVGNCQFLFIGFAEDHAVTELFQTRLRAVFARHGLACDRHVRMLDPMAQGRFLGTVQVADIVLDSIGWSGGKSTLDMLAAAPAIMTQAGAMMRGRHTAAILTAIGVTESIATTIDEYIDIAVHLARDPLARHAIRVKVLAGRHRVYDDPAPIRAMEQVIAKRLDALANGT